MKYCPNCHHDFSDSFDTCVYCGSELNSGENPKPIEIKDCYPKKINWEENNMEKSDKEKCVPRCPTCGSTNIKRISGLSKAGSVAIFGVFALGKASKTFECLNCHYKW